MKLTGKVTTCASGRLVDIWYDRDSRSWVVQLKTPEGDQIGEADYVGSRDWAEVLGARYVLAEGGKRLKKGIDLTRVRCSTHVTSATPNLEKISTMKNPIDSANRFLRKAARVAKAKGIRGLTFTACDLGTFWRTYGVNGTPAQFVAFLTRKKQP